MESMTTTTDPLSPECVEAALKWAQGKCRMFPEIREYSALAALARAHLAATKREPPAGLVEVIAGVTGRHGVRVQDYGIELALAIARAVEAFATSPDAIDRAAVACDGTPAGHDDTLYMIRAALGATEECK